MQPIIKKKTLISVDNVFLFFYFVKMQLKFRWIVSWCLQLYHLIFLLQWVPSHCWICSMVLWDFKYQSVFFTSFCTSSLIFFIVEQKSFSCGTQTFSNSTLLYYVLCWGWQYDFLVMICRDSAESTNNRLGKVSGTERGFWSEQFLFVTKNLETFFDSKHIFWNCNMFYVSYTQKLCSLFLDTNRRKTKH